MSTAISDNVMSIAIGVVNIFSSEITKRGSGLPVIWRYPAGNDAAKEDVMKAISDKIKQPQTQIVIPTIDGKFDVEVLGASDTCLTAQERNLYNQAISIVSQCLTEAVS